MQSQTKNKSLLDELIERRFFQFFGTYLGVGFAVIQFCEFLEKRYDLMDNLVERMLIFLLCLLPAVIIFIYNHGRKGPDNWTRFEKWFIPLNVLLAFGASLLLGTSNIGHDHQEVSIITETGDTLSRMVPSIDDTKRITIFPFEGKNDDDNAGWRELAYARLFSLDIEQNVHFIGIDPLYLKNDYEQFGVDWLDQIPFSIKLKIAQESYSEYFLDAEYEILPSDSVLLMARLIDANNGELFYEGKYTSADWLSGIDWLTKEVKSGLIHSEIDASDGYIDLPASDLISDRDDALAAYVLANKTFTEDASKFDEASVYAEKSIDLDPNCAECLAEMAFVRGMQSRNQEEIQLYAKAMAKSIPLSERQKMMIRYRYYYSTSDFDKARILLNNWISLYPSDSKPYLFLISIYKNSLEYDKAIKTGELALENGHRSWIIPLLSELYLKNGDISQAEAKYRLYKESYPHKASESTLSADISIYKAEYQKALNYLQEQSLNNPNNQDVRLKMAFVLERLGQFKEAMDEYDSTLAIAANIQDSLAVLRGKEQLLMLTGRVRDAIELQEYRYGKRQKLVPPIYADLGMIRYYARYIWSGQEDVFRSKMNFLREKHREIPWTKCVLNHVEAIMAQDTMEYPIVYEKCKDMMTSMNGENYGFFMDATLQEFTEEYKEAVSSMKAYIDSTGVNVDGLMTKLASLHRQAGDLDEAKTIVAKEIEKHPYEPYTLVEMSKIERDQKNKSKAQEYLKRALDVWKDADPQFIHANDAKELYESISKVE